MSFVGNAVFHIGQWRVYPALDEISHDDKTVKLEPRTMRVLLCLAERPGEVMSVNQLLDVVWKDRVRRLPGNSAASRSRNRSATFSR